jgi:hypothetical protein
MYCNEKGFVGRAVGRHEDLARRIERLVTPRFLVIAVL